MRFRFDGLRLARGLALILSAALVSSCKDEKSDVTSKVSAVTAAGDRMLPGQTLGPNQFITSPNLLYELGVASFSQLLLRKNPDKSVLWSSGSLAWPKSSIATMRSDGNLVVHDTLGPLLWQSNTAGNAGSYLVLQNDGNAVIYRPNGTSIFSTNTSQAPQRYVYRYAGKHEQENRRSEGFLGFPPLDTVLYGPIGITRAFTGNLFISERDNNRVIIERRGNLELFARPTVGFDGHNLLESPHSGAAPPWQQDGTGVQISWRNFRPGIADCPDCPQPFEGDSYLSAARSEGSTIYQIVDVEDLRFDIDAARVDFAFSAYVLSRPSAPNDWGQITVEFLNASKQSFSPAAQFDSGLLAATGQWRRIYDKRRPPVGTRFVRVALRSQPGNLVTFPGLLFDALSLVAVKGTATELHGPHGIVNADSPASPADSVIVANMYDHTVIKLSLIGQPTPLLQVLAGASNTPGTASNRLNAPTAVAIGPNGDLFIADYANHRIMRRTPSGTVSRFAGTGERGWSGDGGPATLAKLSYPVGIAVSASNTVYIAERGNNIIRRVSADGTIVHLAGTGAVGYSGDGAAPRGATFGTLDSLAVGTDGYLYISDIGNHNVRRLTNVSNPISTVLGLTERPPGSSFSFTGDGGPAILGWFDSPSGLFVDRGSNAIFIADAKAHFVRTVDCGDYDRCNGVETYNASTGACVLTASPPVIGDNDACTDDVCVPATGQVSHNPISVEDGNACTKDGCDVTWGVTHTPSPGDKCSDGNACTENDACTSSATCLGQPVLIKDDENPCTNGACNPATGVISHVPTPPGTACGTGLICDGARTCEAPPPTLVVPPLDPTRATPLAEAVKFIYQGANAIQTGVPANAIDSRRVALITGKVKTSAGTPFPNVRVSVPASPEYGQTVSRADGRFDLVVNGGGGLSLRFDKTRSFSADRLVTAVAQETKDVGDIVLKQADEAATAVVMGGGDTQVAESSLSSDTDGERRAVVMVPPNTAAQIRHPDGTVEPMGALTLRMTEYTVGADGPQAMPAPLTPTTAYTYAVEVSADEAVTAGATSVEFDRAVAFYVDNYLDFPVGKKVPAGYYDKDKKAWVPSDSGVVVEIITAPAGGLATLDVDGDQVSTQAEMDAIGVTLGERANLAERYPPGAELWRVPIKHLTPWDCNWPYGPPPCLQGICPGPTGSGVAVGAPICSTPAEGSIIECEVQGLGESVAVAGTPHTLNYRSTREPGYAGRRQVRLDLTGPQIHPELAAIEVDISVAGQKISKVYTPAANLRDVVTWDGLDEFGRPWVGGATANVTITAVYKAVYYDAQAFGEFSVAPGVRITADRAANTIRYPREFSVDLLGRSPRDGWSLGGWTLSNHHFYESRGGILYRGDGQIRDAEPAVYLVRRLAGNGTTDYGADGGPAVQSGIHTGGEGFAGVALAANGDVYFSDTGHRVVRRIDSQGRIWTVAGMNGANACGGGSIGDGGPATAARLGGPTGLAVGPDGSIYIADVALHSIRRVTPDGIIRTIAGSTTCVAGATGDGGPGTAALLKQPRGVAVADDGTVYFVDYGNAVVRKIDPAGVIRRAAGNGALGGGRADRDNKPALTAPMNPEAVAVGLDGTLYILMDGYELLSVSADGMLRVLTAPFNTTLQTIDGVPLRDQTIDITACCVAVDRQGRLLFSDSDWQRAKQPDGQPRSWVRAVDRLGNVTSRSAGVAGTIARDDAPALQHGPFLIFGLAAAPNDAAIIQSDRYIYRVEHPHLGGASACADVNARYMVPDKSEGYCFDESGRHLSTLDLRTGQRLHNFVYDNGRLSAFSDPFSNVTQIAHTANQITITAPFGQTTTLRKGANGYLDSISDAVGQVIPEHDAGGLLRSYVDRVNTRFEFGYDANGFGFLESDRGAVGIAGKDSTQRLSRTAIPGGNRVEHRTPLDRMTAHEMFKDTGNVLTQRTILPGNRTTTRKQAPNGVTTVTFPDRSSIMTVAGPGGRFGMNRPITTTRVVTLPSGRTLATAQTQEAALSAAGNPMSLISETTWNSVGGGPQFMTVYDAATRTETITSAVGRKRFRTSDAFGRTTRVEVEGVTPWNIFYDARGRLDRIERGTRVKRFAYETVAPGAGYLNLYTNPLNELTSFGRDALGRLRSVTQGSAIAQFVWDANDNLKEVWPPSRPLHGLDYDPFNRLSAYRPPVLTGNDGTTYAQDLDRRAWKETRQGALISTNAFDPNGQLDTITRPEGVIDHDYYVNADTAAAAAPGRAKIIRSGPGGVNLGFKYDGPLTTAVDWSGAVVGSVSWEHDSAFRRSREVVSGSAPAGARAVTFGYDNDGLMVCASPTSCSPPAADALNIVRARGDGLVTNMTMGNVTESRTYNAFGELATQTVFHGGSQIASLTYDSTAFPRDGLGRIKQKAEVINGLVQNHDYVYDTRGRLQDVFVGGVLREHFDYHPNGARSGYTGSPVGSIVPVTDAQDRLTAYGPYTFAYTNNGERSSMTQTSTGAVTRYTYDKGGGLTRVERPSPLAPIDYVLDGGGRRVAKKVNGAIVKRWIYRDPLRIAAELDAVGNVLAQFVYTTDGNTPDFVVRSNKIYRVISDQIGSPRYVVNVADAADVPFTATYTAFGEAAGTGHDWLPFGFAGGHYDVDTKLVRFGARDYDAMTGTWTAKDPKLFIDGPNLYAYVNNNPVGRKDATGMTDIYKELGRAADFCDKIREIPTSAYDLVMNNIDWNEQCSDACYLAGINQCECVPYHGGSLWRSIYHWNDPTMDGPAYPVLVDLTRYNSCDPDASYLRSSFFNEAPFCVPRRDKGECETSSSQACECQNMSSSVCLSW